MSFKNPITVAKLKTIKAQMYIKTLTGILKNKLQDGQTVSCRIITNHIYNGLDKSKSEKLPLLLIGTPKDGETAWKKFGETPLEGKKKQKDFMLVGLCSRNENVLVFTINKSKGMSKFPKPIERRVNALLNKIVKGMTMTARGGVEEGGDEAPETPQTDPSGAMASAAAGNQSDEQTEKETKKPRPKNKEEAIQQYKEEKIEEAKALSDLIAKFRQLFEGPLQKVVANVKAGSTTKKDLKTIKETNQAYDAAVKAYRSAAKPVQKEFKKGYDELQAGKKELYKLTLATKEKRQSMAQIVADTYFQEKEQRVANDQEINKVQGFIKQAININRTGGYKAPEATVIHGVSYLMKRVGISKYKSSMINELLSKRQAA